MRWRYARPRDASRVWFRELDAPERALIEGKSEQIPAGWYEVVDPNIGPYFLSPERFKSRFEEIFV